MKTILAAAAMALLGTVANAAEIKVIGSPGLREAYTDLLPGFEKLTGNHVTTVWGGVQEIAKRVAEGETADVVLLPRAQIDELVKSGKLLAASRADIAKSGVGVAIKAGAPKIDISNGDAVKRAMLAAKTISYSTGPSGVHMADVIKTWGLTDQLKGRIVIAPPDTPVGVVLARGQAEIGFQQVSELMRSKGVDYLGELPADIDEVTQFSAAVHKDAKEKDAAAALVKYLSAPAAAPVIRKTGMAPG